MDSTDPNSTGTGVPPESSESASCNLIQPESLEGNVLCNGIKLESTEGIHVEVVLNSPKDPILQNKSSALEGAAVPPESSESASSNFTRPESLEGKVSCNGKESEFKEGMHITVEHDPLKETSTNTKRDCSLECTLADPACISLASQEVNELLASEKNSLPSTTEKKTSLPSEKNSLPSTAENKTLLPRENNSLPSTAEKKTSLPSEKNSPASTAKKTSLPSDKNSPTSTAKKKTSLPSEKISPASTAEKRTLTVNQRRRLGRKERLAKAKQFVTNTNMHQNVSPKGQSKSTFQGNNKQKKFGIKSPPVQPLSQQKNTFKVNSNKKGFQFKSPPVQPLSQQKNTFKVNSKKKGFQFKSPPFQPVPQPRNTFIRNNKRKRFEFESPSSQASSQQMKWANKKKKKRRNNNEQGIGLYKSQKRYQPSQQIHPWLHESMEGIDNNRSEFNAFPPFQTQSYFDKGMERNMPFEKGINSQSGFNPFPNSEPILQASGSSFEGGNNIFSEFHTFPHRDNSILQQSYECFQSKMNSGDAGFRQFPPFGFSQQEDAESPFPRPDSISCQGSERDFQRWDKRSHSDWRPSESEFILHNETGRSYEEGFKNIQSPPFPFSGNISQDGNRRDVFENGANIFRSETNPFSSSGFISQGEKGIERNRDFHTALSHSQVHFDKDGDMCPQRGFKIQREAFETRDNVSRNESSRFSASDFWSHDERDRKEVFERGRNQDFSSPSRSQAPSHRRGTSGSPSGFGNQQKASSSFRNKNTPPSNTKVNSNSNTFAMAIVPMDYPNCNIQNNQSQILQSVLVEEFCVLSSGGFPQFSKSYVSDGAFFLTCMNGETLEWLENAVPNIRLEGIGRLKLVQRKNITNQIRISFRTSAIFAKTHPNKIIEMLGNQNKNLNTSNWRVVSTKDGTFGQTLVVQIDNQSHEAMIKSNYKAFLGLGQISFVVLKK